MNKMKVRNVGIKTLDTKYFHFLIEEFKLVPDLLEDAAGTRC